MIQQKNISKISNKLFETNGKKSKRIPEAVIEKDYCLTWFLIGLSKSSLKDKLAFKGGTCLRRCFFKDYRFSEDLDFTLLSKISLGDLLAKIGKMWEQRLSQQVAILPSFGDVFRDVQRNFRQCKISD